MTDTTTIEINTTTLATLNTLRFTSESFDDLLNKLIRDHEEVNKYIGDYIESADGECVAETVMGRAVIANHHFVGSRCEKCGACSPILVDANGIIKIDV